jgi:carbon storage regulator CsrA
MLILSRKEAEKILFPTLDITIEVLRIQGHKTRLGIDAPSDIPVVRHELSGLKSVEFTAECDPTKENLSRLLHALRLRLDRAALPLNRLHRRLEASGDTAGQALILEVFRELRALEREAGESLEPAPDRATRVLLVEDHASERELLSSILRLSGIEVTTACDGQEALDYLSLHAPPDVVLLDMLMPRCDGPTFVREVREKLNLARLKIFAVSGRSASSLGVVTGPGGVDRWFEKPVDPERLVTHIPHRLLKVCRPSGGMPRSLISFSCTAVNSAN